MHVLWCIILTWEHISRSPHAMKTMKTISTCIPIYCSGVISIWRSWCEVIVLTPLLYLQVSLIPIPPFHRSESSSRSTSPEVGRVEYITEFGGGEGGEKQPENSQKKSINSPREYSKERERRNRSRSRSPARRHSYRRRSRSRSR